MDVRTGEVSNWVWIASLLTVPIAVFRTWANELLLYYLLQTGLVFGLSILTFHLGILGGGDGKTIWVLSLVYPWLEIDLLMVLFAAFLVLWGGFLITGVHGLVVFLRNLLKWRHYTLTQKKRALPDKQRYWLIKIFSRPPTTSEPAEWKTVHVPFIAYILIAYFALFAMTLLT